MIDCHCHLADESFNKDIAEVIEKAKQAGVVHAIVVAEFHFDFQRILELAMQFPDFVLPGLGMHPVQQGFVSASESLYKSAGVEQRIRTAADRLRCVGEVGLDFSPRYLTNGDGDKQQQHAVFKAQIELAKELGLPLNVHSRSAGTPVIEFLQENGARDVLLHAFSGNLKAVRLGLDAGYYFSMPPSFTMSVEKEAFVREIPLDRLCLESDSPVLGPNRNERNEPANIRLCAEFIARIKGVDVDEVIQATSQNARKLFRLEVEA